MLHQGFNKLRSTVCFISGHTTYYVSILYGAIARDTMMSREHRPCLASSSQSPMIRPISRSPVPGPASEVSSNPSLVWTLQIAHDPLEISHNICQRRLHEARPLVTKDPVVHAWFIQIGFATSAYLDVWILLCTDPSCH